jgi:DNA-binding NarL/FixJ family response regulator
MAEVFDLIEEVVGMHGLQEFLTGLLAALRLVPGADIVSLNDMGPGPEDMALLAAPPLSTFPAETVEAFKRYGHQNPLLQRARETGDGRAYRFSDAISAEELHELELYRTCYLPLGVEHQIAFMLPAPRNRVLGVALSRGDRDFSDAERDLLNRARPVLIDLYRAVLELEHSEALTADDGLVADLIAAGLSDREATVVSYLAHGLSNADIGKELGISDRTVQAHLRTAFSKLGVANRSEAAAKSWRLARAAD